jgi:archaellum component FlaF (FlaF/FlaG flagellin family)
MLYITENEKISFRGCKKEIILTYYDNVYTLTNTPIKFPIIYHSDGISVILTDNNATILDTTNGGFDIMYNGSYCDQE